MCLPSKGSFVCLVLGKEEPLGPRGPLGLFVTQSPSSSPPAAPPPPLPPPQHTSCRLGLQSHPACYTASFFTEFPPQRGQPQLGGAPEQAV